MGNEEVVEDRLLLRGVSRRARRHPCQYTDRGTAFTGAASPLMESTRRPTSSTSPDGLVHRALVSLVSRPNLKEADMCRTPRTLEQFDHALYLIGAMVPEAMVLR